MPAGRSFARDAVRGAVALAIASCAGRGGAQARVDRTTVPAGAAARIALPGGERGIGFDDMRADPATGAVFVPAGVTGRVFAFAPGARAPEAFAGFAHGAATTGHGNGPTSVDFGPAGVLFVADRTSRTIDVVDRASRAIVARAPLGGHPDYVRYVAATNELWVTEPREQRIEVFDLAPFTRARAAPTLERTIAVPGGPESLEIDAARGRAYTNVWTGARTLAIDVATATVRGNWASGCRHDDTQGLALDAARGQLFVGCENGDVVALDVEHDGRQLGRAHVGDDVDIISYSPALHHVYVPSGGDGMLNVVGVAPSGGLSVLGHVAAARGTHCAAAGRDGAVFVCDPAGGTVVVVDDPFPAS